MSWCLGGDLFRRDHIRAKRQLHPNTGNKRRIAEVRRRAEKDTALLLFSAFLSDSALLGLLISFPPQPTQFRSGTTAQFSSAFIHVHPWLNSSSPRAFSRPGSDATHSICICGGFRRLPWGGRRPAATGSSLGLWNADGDPGVGGCALGPGR